MNKNFTISQLNGDLSRELHNNISIGNSSVKQKNKISENQRLLMSLERSDLTVAYQRKSFDALLAIAESLGDSPTIEDLLKNAIKPIQEVTGFSTIAMRIHDPEKKVFHLVAYTGLSAYLVEILKDLPDSSSYYESMISQKHPSYIAVLPGQIPYEWGFRRIICVPFLTEDVILGTMDLTTILEYDWGEDELRWFRLVGRYLGMLIKQIQLNEQLKNMAILQERSRIAQELHDGLVQTVGAINIWSQEAKLSLKEGEKEKVSESLNKIEISAQDAYIHLREEMFGLRVLFTPGQDIIPLLNNLLVRFQHLWGIKTHFNLHINHPENPSISLSADVEIQLLRVIQEALTNIRRHANAKNVTVTLNETKENLMVVINDDGLGFDPSKSNGDGLGLHIMYERVIGVGGKINISSQSGKGTTITIELPKKSQTHIFQKGATNVDDISG